MDDRLVDLVTQALENARKAAALQDANPVPPNTPAGVGTTPPPQPRSK